MREPPAPSPSTFTIVSKSRPAFSPSTKASAAETLWIATSRFARNFIFEPFPNAPRWKCVRAKPSKTGTHLR